MPSAMDKIRIAFETKEWSLISEAYLDLTGIDLGGKKKPGRPKKVKAVEVSEAEDTEDKNEVITQEKTEARPESVIKGRQPKFINA